MGLVPTIKDGDWTSVRKALQRIAGPKLGIRGTPTFADLTLTGLTASELLSTDSSKILTSVADLTAWIAGTTNQVIVTDDGDGTLTLSAPQNIHVDATPEFAGFVIKDSGDNIVAFMDDSEFYITYTAPAEIVTGNPIGLLLALTYTL